jgi:Sec7-like guanine-nucleotide exchange factor
MELRDNAQLRKFSLQALVEIADLNMSRIRFVWSKLWDMMSEHFVWVGAHQNLHMAIFAIDSLRQLADKFLLIEDFQSFNFQKDFLFPFEEIIIDAMHKRCEIKDFIVDCIVMICRRQTMYIKSGWSVIINIFTLAAQDSEKQIVEKSFNALEYAIKQHFDMLKGNFIELINCLNKYCQNSKFE